MWEIGIKDIIDILIVAWGMFWLYRNSQRNGTLVLFQGILAVLICWLVVSQMLHMKLLGAIFNGLISVGLITLVIIFQNDIRRTLMRVGSRRSWKSMLEIFNRKASDKDRSWVDPLVLACRNMAEKKVGALICIEADESIQPYITGGEEIDAKITTRLVEQIFFKNSPLHDGAMIIRNGRIWMAACVLPVSKSLKIPKELGLRHRSGIGLSEQCDALVLIVSEETGDISLVKYGKIHRQLSVPALQKLLRK